MFRADVLVLQLRSLILGLREDLVDGLGDIDLRDVHAARHFGEAIEFPLRRQLHRAHGQAELLDKHRHDAALLTEQRGKQVPRLHLVV